MAADGGFQRFFLKLCKIYVKTFFFSYLCSEIKTKPKNHGLMKLAKPPPPLVRHFIKTQLISLNYLKYIYTDSPLKVDGFRYQNFQNSEKRGVWGKFS